MQDFKLTLDGKEYDVRSTSSSHTKEGEKRSWDVLIKHGDIMVDIRIPISKNLTRAKVILFIEAFHCGIRKAFDEQGIDQNYTWNQKTQIT